MVDTWERMFLGKSVVRPEGTFEIVRHYDKNKFVAAQMSKIIPLRPDTAEFFNYPPLVLVELTKEEMGILIHKTVNIDVATAHKRE